MTRVLALSAVCALAFATPAHAQLFGGKRQDEAIASIQARVAELQTLHTAAQAEIKAVTAAHNATRGELTAASARVDDMEATVRSLNGTAETLAADLAAARRDLGAAQAQNKDLLDRLARVESAQAALTVASAVPAATTAPSDPTAAFAAARGLMDAGRFAEAGDAFEAYAVAHSAQPNAAEANYWLGETLYVRDNPGDAAQAYIVALKGWPQSPWAPDALVKLSTSLIALKQPAEACKTLGEFDRRYGSAPAPVKARAKAARTTAKCKA